MIYLVVVAHPDDEVLGAGATLYKLAKEGHKINVCILSGIVRARENNPEIKELKDNIISSSKILGIKKVMIGDFPNIEFNTVPHIKLVQMIENIINITQAEIIITHHPSDLDIDHLHTSLACQAAVRLVQHRDNVTPIKEVLFMEVPASTDWGLNRAINQFNPNTFMEVGEESVNKKIEALEKYQGVIQDYPHPRSAKAIIGLATYRGSQAGMVYAEAFECAYRRREFEDIPN
ncbi:PIG-L family deacetylase [Anaerocolumna sp. AGMB13025]|uniref:PIG-L deacetylase family protein n=1 Tax=Anaerocolumna sp. AGMB13025 TaxID=3039116 RepID=UPI00241E8CC8|nr:PIG-L deacetylase family protein [Anaerocolumna sp. AGMB13025]WFR60100.1 PIG-L family deacetylase [Anaerocolumna sp. AGMB13025]